MLRIAVRYHAASLPSVGEAVQSPCVVARVFAIVKGDDGCWPLDLALGVVAGES